MIIIMLCGFCIPTGILLFEIRIKRFVCVNVNIRLYLRVFVGLNGYNLHEANNVQKFEILCSKLFSLIDQTIFNCR